MGAMTGRVTLDGDLVPTLITFADLKDPKTARVVTLDGFEAAFGAGYRFRSASIEMVPVGWWPLNLIGITGTPITRGIETRLVWWNNPGRPTAIAWRAWLAGETRGPSIEPEKLFRR